MHFTVIQIIIMFLIGYVCLYALIDRVMKCIEHCATARAYGRFREAGVKTKMDDEQLVSQNQKRRKIMLRRDLIKNKIYGIIFIILGALTIPIEWDATFFLFALMVGILLFVSRENCIMD